MSKVPDFDVVVRLRNNHLVSFREALGWSAPRMAKEIGVEYDTYIAYESLRRSPLSKLKHTIWKDSALKIAQFMRMSPEAIWPEAVQKVKLRQIQLKIDAPRALALAELGPKQLPAPDAAAEEAEMKTCVHGALDTLNPRHRKILERKFGLNGEDPVTLSQLAEEEDVDYATIAQAEQRALRNLRWGKDRAKLLREFITE